MKIKIIQPSITGSHKDIKLRLEVTFQKITMLSKRIHTSISRFHCAVARDLARSAFAVCKVYQYQSGLMIQAHQEKALMLLEDVKRPY